MDRRKAESQGRAAAQALHVRGEDRDPEGAIGRVEAGFGGVRALRDRGEHVLPLAGGVFRQGGRGFRQPAPASGEGLEAGKAGGGPGVAAEPQARGALRADGGARGP